jgi:hypothetical protein
MAKAKTTYSATNARINKLLTWSVETGALTAIMAILELTFWLATPQYNFHFLL